MAYSSGTSFGTHPAGAVLLLWLAAIISGCSQHSTPIFEELPHKIVWPPPPAKERIRYVGQLRSSADLHRSPKPFQAIADFFMGEKAQERLYGPRCAVSTAHGTVLWIADPGGRCLHVFDLQKRSYKKIERVGDSHLLSPVGLCLGPEESIFVCDAEDVAIHRFSARSGVLLESLRLSGEMGRPVALSYHAETRELYVVDVNAHHVKVLGLDGRLHRIIGRRGSRQGEFNYPCDIADEGDVIWIVDAGNHRVQGLTVEGEPLVAFGAGDTLGDLALPKGIAVDREGHIYVVDARFENVQIFDRLGNLLLFFGEEGTGPGEFWLPSAIFIDENDRIWICDQYNGRVQVFDYVKHPEEGGSECSPAPQSP